MSPLSGAGITSGHAYYDFTIKNLKVQSAVVLIYFRTQWYFVGKGRPVWKGVGRDTVAIVVQELAIPNPSLPPST